VIRFPTRSWQAPWLDVIRELAALPNVALRPSAIHLDTSRRQSTVWRLADREGGWLYLPSTAPAELLCRLQAVLACEILANQIPRALVRTPVQDVDAAFPP